MHCGFLCGVLLVVVSMKTVCQGERLVISAKPTTISPGVTPELIVRCGLEDDGNRRASRLNSIVIRTVDGSDQKDVARIVYGQEPTGGFSTTNDNVIGDLSKNVGYLQVIWPDPKHDQARQYSCEIAALGIGGNNIKFRSNVQVDSTGENVDSSDSQQCKCTEDIEALKKAVDDLKTDFSGLRSVHNEEGTVVCENSDSWGENYKDRETVKEVQFSTAYDTNPLVIVSPVTLDVDKLKNVRYKIEIRDLTTTGFKVVCGTWFDTSIFRMEVRWISSVA